MLKIVLAFCLCGVSMIWTETEATTIVRSSRHAPFYVATGLVIVNRATSKFTTGWRRSHQQQHGTSKVKHKPLEDSLLSKVNSKSPGATVQKNTTNTSTGSDKDIWLAKHNEARALYGSPPLTWDPILEDFARQVSEKCKFEHTVGGKYGENLAGGWPPVDGVTAYWVSGPDEKESWDPAEPKGSHFTQVVWKRTTRLGCAGTNCNSLSGYPGSKGYMFWVCEYICDDPRGYGTFAENIQALKGGEPAV